MMDLFLEHYGMEGTELATAAMLKLYITDDENRKKALGKALGLGSIVDNAGFTDDIEIYAAQLAVLINQAKAYCARKVQDSDYTDVVCQSSQLYGSSERKKNRTGNQCWAGGFSGRLL